VFGNFTLREIGVARCDQFIKQLAKRSQYYAKQARVVLRRARAGGVARDPSTQLDGPRRPPVPGAAHPDALTAPEVNVIRAAISRRESGADHTSGPNPTVSSVQSSK
jgi:hypothetical protein